MIGNYLDIGKHSDLREFLIRKFISSKAKRYLEIDYLSAIEVLRQYLPVDVDYLINRSFEEFRTLDDYPLIKKVSDIWPNRFEELIIDDEAKKESVYDIIDKYINEFEDDYIDDAVDTIYNICSLFLLDDSDYELELKNKLEERGINPDKPQDDYYEEWRLSREDDTESIEEIFKSLL